MVAAARKQFRRKTSRSRSAITTRFDSSHRCLLARDRCCERQIRLASARSVQVSAATTFHGADTNKVQQAVNAEKLQAKANWCGIAAIAWVAYYRGNHSIAQQQVDDYLNSPDAVSPWGTPSKDPYSGGPGVKADISRDSGTDPRAHVVGLRVHHSIALFTIHWAERCARCDQSPDRRCRTEQSADCCHR